MSSITQRETQQVEQANASGRTPVVFIHGLWLLPSSWNNWAALFDEAGYAPVTPDWPDDPETVEQAQGEPRRIRQEDARADRGPHRRGHRSLEQEAGGDGPLDRGAAGADHRGTRSVRRDGGDRSGTVSRRAAAADQRAEVGLPVLKNPSNRGRAITLTLDEFKYGWANALSDDEAKQLYETYHVAAPGVALMQMANANLNPFTEAKADTKNPDRGPLLIIDGEKDHTVPWAIANASFKRQRRNAGVTEIKQIPNRGHSLTIDSGWREVAQTALEFVKRFV